MPAAPKTSTLLKGTSVSDGRRQGAQAQRALTDTRREIKPADLAKAAAGTKRGRENETYAAPSKSTKQTYGRVLVPLSTLQENAEAIPETLTKNGMSDTVSSGDSFGSMGSGRSKGSRRGSGSVRASTAQPPTSVTQQNEPISTTTAGATKGAGTKKAPVKTARPPPRPVDGGQVPRSKVEVGGEIATSKVEASTTLVPSTSIPSSVPLLSSIEVEPLFALEESVESAAPVTARSGAGVAGDFMFEDGEHLVFKDKRWEKDALPVAKRLLAKAKYGGSPEEFRSFALRLIIKRVALENYIKSHHEELRRDVMAAKAASVTAATQKAVSESNAVADFAKQITASKKDAAKWHSLADSLGAELESLKAASAMQGANASAMASLEMDVARLSGELASARGECAGLKEVFEAEVAAAVAAGEAAVAAARAEGAADLEEERRCRMKEAEMAVAVAASRAEAPMKAALESLQVELNTAQASINILENSKVELTRSVASLKASVATKEAEIRELEEGLAAAVGEAEEGEGRCKELAAALSKAHSEVGEWRGRWAYVDTKRAQLLEQNLSLKGAIRVFARVRPPLPGEEATVGGGSKLGVNKSSRSALNTIEAVSEPLFQFPCATADDATDLEVCELPGAGIGGYGRAEEGKRTSFKLQRIFPPTSSQEEVFGEVEGLVQSALDGHKVGIFAYGQTGSGKTWTMEGDMSNLSQSGIIPRSVDLIFERCKRLEEQGWACTLTVEMLEIHNESIRDLLAGSRGSLCPSLDLKHDPKTGSPRVEGLSLHNVSNTKEVHSLLLRASAARSTGTTAMNERSSRSHMVFTLRVTSTHVNTRQSRTGVLHLVDLAGSERLDKSRVNDAKSGGSAALLTETKNINSSLLALGACVSALQAKAPHIPYRDSKLTDLLSETLGGKDSRTLVLCTLNPLHSNVSESLSTLNFAKKCAAVTK